MYQFSADQTASRIRSSEDFGPRRFHHLTLTLREWQDSGGRQCFHESCHRLKRSSCGIDSVTIISKVLAADRPPRLALLARYRPAIDAICLELPTGAISEGEDAASAALRELTEKTGFCGHILDMMPVCYNDPNVTSSNTQLAFLSVDLEDRLNRSPRRRLTGHSADDDCTELAPWDGLLSWLVDMKNNAGCTIDARLLTFAMGMRIAPVLLESTEAHAGGRGRIWTVPMPPPQLLHLKSHSCGRSQRVEASEGNNASSAMHDGYEIIKFRSDSATTDVIFAMNQMDIQRAAKEYANALSEFRADAGRKAVAEAEKAERSSSSSQLSHFSRDTDEMSMKTATTTSQKDRMV